MSIKRTQQTNNQQIRDYWFSAHSGNEYALIYEEDLNVDACDTLTHCWRCGTESKLEKCHIVPHALGGKDEPSNYVLLCHRCHLEGPNVSDPKYMWDWLYASKTRFSFYNSWEENKILDKYESIYGELRAADFADLDVNEAIERLDKIQSVTHAGGDQLMTLVSQFHYALHGK